MSQGGSFCPFCGNIINENVKSESRESAIYGLDDDTQKKYQTPQVTICQLETSTLMACSNEIGYDPDITTDGTARSNRNFWDNGLWDIE